VYRHSTFYSSFPDLATLDLFIFFFFYSPPHFFFCVPSLDFLFIPPRLFTYPRFILFIYFLFPSSIFFFFCAVAPLFNSPLPDSLPTLDLFIFYSCAVTRLLFTSSIFYTVTPLFFFNAYPSLDLFIYFYFLFPSSIFFFYTVTRLISHPHGRVHLFHTFWVGRPLPNRFLAHAC
jgi:hypothetical protein